MTAAGAIEPLEIGPWHIHGGWWTVLFVALYVVLAALLLFLLWDDLELAGKIEGLETRMKAIEDALAVPHDLDLADDTPTDQIPAQQPAPAPGPPTTPTSAAIDAGHRKVVETYQREELGYTFNFRKQ